MSHSGDSQTMAQITQQRRGRRQACSAGRMFNPRITLDRRQVGPVGCSQPSSAWRLWIADDFLEAGLEVCISDSA